MPKSRKTGTMRPGPSASTCCKTMALLIGKGGMIGWGGWVCQAKPVGEPAWASEGTGNVDSGDAVPPRITWCPYGCCAERAEPSKVVRRSGGGAGSFVRRPRGGDFWIAGAERRGEDEHDRVHHRAASAGLGDDQRLWAGRAAASAAGEALDRRGAAGDGAAGQ